MKPKAGTYRRRLPRKPEMPKGTIHRETGILRRAPLGHALEMDGGGRWVLDKTEA